MEALFLKLVNLSLTASILVIAVILLRLIFRKAPKWIFCLLWGLVALRLVLPFSIESYVSLIPSPKPLPDDIIYSANPQIQSGIAIIDDAINPILSDSFSANDFDSANPAQVWSFILAWVWLIGMVAMLGYMLISTALLKHKLRTATIYNRGIKQSEFVDSPFVLGIFRPVIYLPYGIDGSDLDYVIAHEKTHIRRKDHLWKPLGFLLLSIYWFNPLLWAAYILLCRDIESACDEKVVREMDKGALRAYSAALLRCSIHRRRIAACPLAFGEVGVKQRIKNVMNYKKPAFWIIITAVAVCIAAALCFLTDPVDNSATLREMLSPEYAPEGVWLYKNNKNSVFSTFYVNEDMSISGSITTNAHEENMCILYRMVKGSENRAVCEFYNCSPEIANTADSEAYFLCEARIKAKGNMIQFELDEDGERYFGEKKIRYVLSSSEDIEPDQSLLNYKNAMPLIAEKVEIETIYCPHEDKNGNGSISIGYVYSTDLLNFLDKASWKERKAPNDNLSSPDSIEFCIEEDYRITVYKESRWVRVSYKGKEQYYKARRGDYDKAGRLFRNSNSSPRCIKWFDGINGDDAIWGIMRETSIYEFPGVTFQWHPEGIEAVTDKSVVTLYNGIPIWSVYFCDLTGDGKPELCSTVSSMSNVEDKRVIVYDYANGASYKYSDVGIYDYVLIMQDGRLFVETRASMQDELLACGELVYRNNTLQIIYDDVSSVGGADGPEEVIESKEINFKKYFNAMFESEKDGSAIETLPSDSFEDALRYCMELFDAGVLTGMEFESTGVEMTMYYYWRGALRGDMLKNDPDTPEQDWEEWSAYVKRIYSTNGYDEEVFTEDMPCSRIYAKMLAERDNGSGSNIVSTEANEKTLNTILSELADKYDRTGKKLSFDNVNEFLSKEPDFLALPRMKTNLLKSAWIEILRSGFDLYGTKERILVHCAFWLAYRDEYDPEADFMTAMEAYYQSEYDPFDNPVLLQSIAKYSEPANKKLQFSNVETKELDDIVPQSLSIDLLCCLYDGFANRNAVVTKSGVNCKGEDIEIKFITQIRESDNEGQYILSFILTDNERYYNWIYKVNDEGAEFVEGDKPLGDALLQIYSEW